MRDHLIQVERVSGVKPKALQDDGFPVAGAELWSVFWSINSSRSSDSGISYSEIDAYSRLMHTPFNPWEVETLKRMDVEFIRFVTEHQEKTTHARKRSTTRT